MTSRTPSEKTRFVKCAYPTCLEDVNAVCVGRRMGASARPRLSLRKSRGRAMPEGLLGLLDQADVGLGRLPTAREPLFGLLLAHGGDDDHVLPLLPVDGCRHLVLCGELDGVQKAQHFVEVPA